MYNLQQLHDRLTAAEDFIKKSITPEVLGEMSNKIESLSQRLEAALARIAAIEEPSSPASGTSTAPKA